MKQAAHILFSYKIKFEEVNFHIKMSPKIKCIMIKASFRRYNNVPVEWDDHLDHLLQSP